MSERDWTREDYHESRRQIGLGVTRYLEDVLKANSRLDFNDPDDRETLLEAAVGVGVGMSDNERYRFHRVLHALDLKDLYPTDCNEFWSFLAQSAGQLIIEGHRPRRGRPPIRRT